MGVDSAGSSNSSRGSSSSCSSNRGDASASSTSSAKSSTTGGTAATSEVAKEQAAATATAATTKTTAPQVDFNKSCFSPAPTATAPGLQAPQPTRQSLQPTSVAQRPGLQAPQLSVDLFDPRPLGPPSTFQGPAVSRTPVGLQTHTFQPAVASAPVPPERPADLARTNITFGPDAVATAVSAHSRQVLSEVMATAGVDAVRVSSTARTPQAQAQAMYDNLQSQGVRAQRELYGRYGDQVIDAYEAAVREGMTREATLQAMVDRINELGPSNVSRHLADPAVRNVIDIAPSSIPATMREAFQEALRQHPDIERFLGPSDGDPAYHVEIRQPQND